MKTLFYSACFAGAVSLGTVPVLADNHGGAAEKVYSLGDVAKHAVEKDCWMAIEGKVYDLTAYIPLHPDGPASMVNWCGAEASDGMFTKGIGADHSEEAWKQLETYLIGKLK